MAKDDVVMKMDANTANFVREVERARQKILQVGTSAEQTGAKVDSLASRAVKLSSAWGRIDVGSMADRMAGAFGIPLQPAELLGKAVEFVSGAHAP